MAEVKEKEKARKQIVENTETGREMSVKPTPPRSMAPMQEMEQLMEQIMDNMMPRNWLRPFRWERPSLAEVDVRLPKVDVLDRDSEIVVKAEIPGVNKKDLEVSVSESSVTIKGHSQKETHEEEGDYFRSEISRGSFVRTVGLPCDVDADGAKAAYRDGLLELTLPKQKKARRHVIDIQ